MLPSSRLHVTWRVVNRHIALRNVCTLPTRCSPILLKVGLHKDTAQKFDQWRLHPQKDPHTAAFTLFSIPSNSDMDMIDREITKLSSSTMSFRIEFGKLFLQQSSSDGVDSSTIMLPVKNTKVITSLHDRASRALKSRRISIGNQHAFQTHLVLERGLPSNDAKNLVEAMETKHPPYFYSGTASHFSLHRTVDGCPKMKWFLFILEPSTTATNGLHGPLIIPISISAGGYQGHTSQGDAANAGVDEGGGDATSADIDIGFGFFLMVLGRC